MISAHPSPAHTAGPWRIEDEFIFAADGRRIADTAVPDGQKMSFEEATANARLIAAAPELLKAAKFLLELSELDEPSKYARSRIDDMQRAIARAEGRE